MPLDQVDVDKEVAVEKEMSFFEHLEELRWHLVRSVAAILIIAIAVFVAGDWIFQNLIEAPLKKDFITYRIINQIAPSLEFYPPEFKLTTVNFGEAFITHLKISFLLGLVVSIPYIFWEFWRFISPGLYNKEKRAARGIVFICSMLFFIGASFGFFVISPFAVTFLGNYQIGDVINTPTLSSYVNYLTMFTIPVGLVFELPIIVYFLSKIGLVYPDTMKRYRRHAFVVILLVAAIITPPDVVTQFLIGIPLYFLYEVSIRISARVAKQKKENESLT